MDRAFSRAAGARRVEGNAVRLLRDAGENYPAWLEAISRAERFVYFESYILRDDVSGRRFADALKAKAGEGVPVYLLYDWIGALGKTSARFWASLRAAGIEVRSFNAPRLSSPLGWIQRNHRKSIVVDGRIAFVTGLCVGDDWVGDPERGIAPWRDTGIEVRGPAVVEVEAAFARMWALTGPPIPAVEGRSVAGPKPAGEVAMRIVASEPNQAGLLRVDQLVAAAARESLWLTDAYYAGAPSHAQALRSAARDGVDVRLLVPGTTDIPIVRPLSRAGYRSLLEAGVRIFEWNGTMLHSKTAVADMRWSRVGSTNLNLASWLTNYELDALIENEGFAEVMSRQYLEDLDNATEVLLRAGRRRAAEPEGHADTAAPLRPRGKRGGSGGRAAVGALRLGHTVTSAVTSHRALTSQDAGIVAWAGAAAIVLAIAAVYWPRMLAVPLAIVIAWVGVSLLIRAFRLRRSRRPDAVLRNPERPPRGGSPGS
jgi:cardiolipin synthase